MSERNGYNKLAPCAGGRKNHAWTDGSKRYCVACCKTRKQLEAERAEQDGKQ